MILPLVTETKYTDKSCVLKKGDHPFVKHSSAIDYSKIRKVSRKALEAQFENGVCIAQERTSIEVFVKILNGLRVSDDVEPWALRPFGATGIDDLIAKLSQP